jgi:hypothetical protein
MTIYRYEIEVQLTNRVTGAKDIVTRLEHAYTLNDALMQASLTLGYQHGESDMKIVRCGPPLEDVRRAESQWLQLLTKVEASSLNPSHPPSPFPPNREIREGDRPLSTTRR